MKGNLFMFFIDKKFEKIKSEKFENNKAASWGLDFLSLIIDVVVLLLIFYLFFDLRLVPTGSMIPTVMPSDRVFFEKPSAYLKNISKGDVIMFDAKAVDNGSSQAKVNQGFLNNLFPNKSNEVYYLKRVIAVGGDKFYMKNGTVYINGKKFIPKYKVNSDPTEKDTYSTDRTITVPKGYVFVMGDNRGNSWDSRCWYNKENIRKNKVKGFYTVDGANPITFVSLNMIKAKAAFEFNVGLNISQWKFNWLW
jgi:signal peptidase I